MPSTLAQAAREALTRPGRLWDVGELLARPSVVPAAPGLYGWHFGRAPHPDLPAGRLLYVGIAPRAAPVAGRTPQNLRKRLRTHVRGNASSSTLRRSLGVLLGVELRCTGSGRLVFGPEGEAELNRWMAEHARVCWWEHESPWTAEGPLIQLLDLPLNLAGNASHPFHPRLTVLRARAAAQARSLPTPG
ncbi:GIY-YIG nuclease family protein [Streptomyces sp. SPB074]|uniref:GIY-YIG nuclease family protein n=1 Tax=Streptomyces sp. (strain SPB074) TaxID=465543 RepID=UPI00017F13E1|nr:hypothetical protein [Streptomyces sp. SPB074]EDY43648.1 conserved hypothetical protein [Streptomyces sp. SPB074]